jgi:hypothetical protein
MPTGKALRMGRRDPRSLRSGGAAEGQIQPL